MVCKWIGPGWFLPALTLTFGISSLGTAFVNSIEAACGVRFLLGIFEAGMLPGIAYYILRWYRYSELTFRLSLYIVMSPLAGAFGGLLASGILDLGNFGDLYRWRMIFAIEGTITSSLGIIAFFTMTDHPDTAKWLTEEEKVLAIARVKSERVVATDVLDKIDLQKVFRGLFSPVTICTSFIFLFNNITVSGFAFFLPMIIKGIYPDEPVVTQQLYTVPPYAVGAIFTVLFPYLSWRFNCRSIFLIITSPLTMTGYIMFLASSGARVRYGATFLVAAGSFAYGALTSAHVSANVISDTARTAALGMNSMLGTIGGLISTWSYLPNNGPDFKIGNGLNLAASSLIFLIAIMMAYWMGWDNARRMEKDIEAELADLDKKEAPDLDWKHPGFQWRL